MVLAILDFGLMTEVTDNQKYGMVEAIVHLLNRDYTEIGQDFINLDFIPEGTDTSPIVPALTNVFDAALAGGTLQPIISRLSSLNMLATTSFSKFIISSSVPIQNPGLAVLWVQRRSKEYQFSRARS